MKKKVVVMSIVFWLITAVMVSYLPAKNKSDDVSKMAVCTTTLNYLEADEARKILVQYSSEKGLITAEERSNTLIIKDYSEVVNLMMKILKTIDVKLTILQFTVDLILCTKKNGDNGGMSEELKKDPLLKELRSILKYNHYEKLDSTIIKVKHRGSASNRIRKNLQLELKPRVTLEDGSYEIQTEVVLYFCKNENGQTSFSPLLKTNLALKAKIRTVVGVSKLNDNDKGLIMIISGKAI